MQLIANPAAGGGAVGRRWDEVVRTLRAVFPDLEAVRTERRGHGTELARQAVRAGHDALLSLGGDGTHSEVAAGIAAEDATGRIRLGTLHGGTGGDFSRLVGRGPLDEQARRLRDLPAHPIDLGRVTWGDGRSRVFLNEVSFGMSARICAEVNRSSKRLGGRLTFLTQTLKVLAAYRCQPVRIRVDDRVLEPGPVQTVLFCNGQWAGGGMHFAPRARLADGLLDVTVIREPGLIRSLRAAPHLYDGALLDQPHVDFDRGARLEIATLGEPVGIEADGEVLGEIPARVEVLPGAVSLMAAPEAHL